MGGYSVSPYDQNNLALHVGDHQELVQANRKALIQNLSLPGEPAWLEQTHSTKCVTIESCADRCADAAVTRCKDFPLVIVTADCLPIVLCDRDGTEIAAIHAGWRGLVNGVIENTLAQMHNTPESLMAWIGPGICGTCYEVGKEVKQTFTEHYPFTMDTFSDHGSRYYADLPKMAELILNAQGISNVFQANACTFELKEKFYSYRRGALTGRMATLIWFNN
jgi:YfiH family protein